MNYIEVLIKIEPFTEEYSEIIIAEIESLGFESFVTEDPYLKAYIPVDNFSEPRLKTILSAFISGTFAVSYSLNFIAEQNWNAVWESDFEPITVAGLCTIKAPHHHGLPKTRYTINIDPKMAFGSGHHETTCLMIEGMLELRIAHKRLLDMGCGTGVLSILAAKMGAEVPVHAIDIDPVAVRSSEDNARRNRIPHKVKTLCGDASLIQAGKYDIVLANITRNILLEDLSTYARALRPEGGTILLSGFFEEDIPLLLAEARKCGLSFVSQKVDNRWSMLRLSR